MTTNSISVPTTTTVNSTSTPTSTLTGTSKMEDPDMDPHVTCYERNAISGKDSPFPRPTAVRFSASGSVLCNHDLAGKRLVSRSVRNPDRVFYTCFKDRNEEGCCSFFAWEDKIPRPVGTLAQTPIPVTPKRDRESTTILGSPSFSSPHPSLLTLATNAAAKQNPHTASPKRGRVSTATTFGGPSSSPNRSSLANLVAKAHPNPHHLRTPQRNRSGEGYVLSPGLAVASPLSEGGIQRQDEMRGRYKAQRMDMEVKQDGTRGVEADAERGGGYEQNDGEEDRRRLLASAKNAAKRVSSPGGVSGRESNGRSSEKNKTITGKSPITSHPVPVMSSIAPIKGAALTMEAGNDENPFWDNATIRVKQEEYAHIEPEDPDDVDDDIPMRFKQETEEIDSVSEDDVGETATNGIDWSTVDMDAVEEEAIMKERLSASKSEAQAQGQRKTQTQFPSSPISTLHRQQQVGVDGISSVQEAFPVTPPRLSKRKRTEGGAHGDDAEQDDDEGISRTIPMNNYHGTSASASAGLGVLPPTSRSRIRASVECDDFIRVETKGNTSRSQTLHDYHNPHSSSSHSQIQALSSTMTTTAATTSILTSTPTTTTTTATLTTPLSHHVARQERLLMASERSKEVLRGRVKALERRVEELERLLEEARRR